MNKMDYEYIPHTADIQFRAYGGTIEEVFNNSSVAMFKSICDAKIGEKISKNIEVKGHDLESLMYNFLEELLVIFDSEHFLLSKMEDLKINVENMTLTGKAIGDSSEDYEIHLDIKAITYNEMYVKNENGKWTAQVTLDV